MVSLPFAKDYWLRLLRPIGFKGADICRVLLIFVSTFDRSRGGIVLSTHINLQAFIILLLTAYLFALIFIVLFLELLFLTALLLVISCLLLAFLQLH